MFALLPNNHSFIRSLLFFSFSFFHITNDHALVSLNHFYEAYHVSPGPNSLTTFGLKVVVELEWLNTS